MEEVPTETETETVVVVVVVVGTVVVAVVGTAAADNSTPLHSADNIVVVVDSDIQVASEIVVVEQRVGYDKMPVAVADNLVAGIVELLQLLETHPDGRPDLDRLTLLLLLLLRLLQLMTYTVLEVFHVFRIKFPCSKWPWLDWGNDSTAFPHLPVPPLPWCATAAK
jgi:hypothetical protein